MSAQFIHINTYARESKSWSGTSKAGKAKGGTTSSIRQVIAEATREPGACPHVPEPLPPVTLYGVDASQIPQMCEDYALTMKDAAGRKLAKTGLVCIAGVVSVGEPDRQKWESVKADSLTFLKEKYGDRLKSVVEHKDEAYPHFHFYVVPKPGEKLEDIHEGLKARNDSRRAGNKAGTQNRDYRNAMKRLQDAYSLKVSAKNGLTRVGPSRRRLTRDGWHAEQAAANDLANKLNLYSDTKKVAGSAYKKGFKQGVQNGLASVSDVGEKVGAFFRSVLGPLHKPTAVVARELEEAKKEIQREKEAKELALKQVKEEQAYADKRVKEQYDNMKEDRKQPDNQLKGALETAQKELEKERAARLEAQQSALDMADKNNALHREIKALKEEDHI